MTTRLNITPGDKYGRLTIIREVENINKYRDRFFECKCECGSIKTYRLSQLTRGHTKSCGCYRKEVLSKLYKTHGDSRTKLHMIWCTMLQRCNNVKSQRYKYYGARGIEVCQKWTKYVQFKNWAISHGYEEGLTLERKNNNGNYCPKNCTWIPRSEQPKNARSNILITYKGKTKIASQWAKELNIHGETLRRRIRNGMTGKEAIEITLRNRNAQF